MEKRENQKYENLRKNAAMLGSSMRIIVRWLGRSGKIWKYQEYERNNWELSGPKWKRTGDLEKPGYDSNMKGINIILENPEMMK